MIISVSKPYSWFKDTIVISSKIISFKDTAFQRFLRIWHFSKVRCVFPMVIVCILPPCVIRTKWSWGRGTPLYYRYHGHCELMTQLLYKNLGQKQKDYGILQWKKIEWGQNFQIAMVSLLEKWLVQRWTMKYDLSILKRKDEQEFKIRQQFQNNYGILKAHDFIFVFTFWWKFLNDSKMAYRFLKCSFWSFSTRNDPKYTKKCVKSRHIHDFITITFTFIEVFVAA